MRSSRRLLTQLNSFKASDKADKSSDSKSAEEEGTDHVTYKLFHKPEQAKFSNNAKVRHSSWFSVFARFLYMYIVFCGIFDVGGRFGATS